ncbi:KRAB [Mytilus edulis]|uniref:KRAB n=1 Tax=Mytilus edulis TaxID=6550 RepID=A0A8S3SB46_MYTED|nr:KRAB [Mytilus edulis]
MLMESLLKDLEDEDDQLGQMQETSTLSVIGEAISMSVDVDGNDSDDTGDEPLPCSSTPVHSRPEPQEVLKPMPRYPNSEHQGCSKCDRLAVTVENLQKHILDQNNNMYQLHLRLYQMEQYQYNSQSHNTQNQNGQSYICQTNNQTSNVQANEMQRMCAVHGEEKTFACEQCDKRFSIMADLTRHLKIHEEHPVKFKCTVCGLEFKKAHDCGDHEASHRGDKQHRCTCGKAYIHQTNLYRHKRKCNH